MYLYMHHKNSGRLSYFISILFHFYEPFFLYNQTTNINFHRDVSTFWREFVAILWKPPHLLILFSLNIPGHFLLLCLYILSKSWNTRENTMPSIPTDPTQLWSWVLVSLFSEFHILWISIFIKALYHRIVHWCYMRYSHMKMI